jgi:hypothetical protein
MGTLLPKDVPHAESGFKRQDADEQADEPLGGEVEDGEADLLEVSVQSRQLLAD